MKSILRKEENYSVSEWSGGKTRELMIYPPKCRYADRDFIFRISSATVELDQSDFTSLPDYDRILMVLDGSVVLTYDGKRSVRLGELEQDSFDGGWDTKSFGKITDYNLMVRKGCDGKVDILRPALDAAEAEATLETERGRLIHALYCREGYCIVNAGGEQKMISPGQLLVMDFGEEEPAYTIMGDGAVIRAQVGHDCDIPAIDESMQETTDLKAQEKKEDSRAAAQEPEGPEETAVRESLLEKIRGSEVRISVDMSDESAVEYKGGFAEDYLWSLILSNTQFRGAKSIFRKLGNLVYDDELHRKIGKLERIFATFFVFIIGLMILLSFAMRDGEMDEGKILWIIAAWFVIDSLVVSPLIYYLVLPKPIKSHIHEIDKMTDEEKEALDAARNRNERLERIMKKYSNSGRNVGTVMAEKARREKELDE